MSAPEQGRQSPEPEKQSDSQQQPIAADPNKGGIGVGVDDRSNDTSKLESNPKHPLEEHAKEKTSKTVNQ